VFAMTTTERGTRRLLERFPDGIPLRTHQAYQETQETDAGDPDYDESSFEFMGFGDSPNLFGEEVLEPFVPDHEDVRTTLYLPYNH
jgi:hypothetical protein